MDTLRLAAFSLLIICVASETAVEQLGREYCTDDCEKETWTKCHSRSIPKTTDFYKECAEMENSEISDINQFICKEATPEQFSSIMACVEGKLMAEYGGLYAIDKLCRCGEEAECRKP